MRIDLGKVEAQIRKLEDLKRIASDPEMLALLETVLVNGTSNSAIPTISIQRALSESPKGSKDKEAFRVDTVAPPHKKGSVLAAVRSAAISKTEPFDGYELTREMQSEGFQFVSKTPAFTVIDALRSLVRKGEIEIHRVGKAGQPSKFVCPTKSGPTMNQEVFPNKQKERALESY